MSQIATSTALDSSYNDAGSLTSSTGSSELDQEAFLTLLITQFQYQDPLNPMEDKEFIAQLAQFTALEQSMEMNEKMDQLIQSTDYQTTISISSYIGKEVSARGYGISKEGGNVSLVQYAGDQEMAACSVNILDSNNSVIATVDIGAKASGAHDFYWDGKTSTGAEAPDGVYTVAFSAVNSNGEQVFVDTSVSGRVTGTTFYNGEYYLRLSDGRSVTLSNVREVVEAGVTVNGETIVGSDDDNFIEGSEGSDKIDAKGGNDIIVYDPIDESVDGGSGFDFLIAEGDVNENATNYEAIIRGTDAADINSMSALKGLGLTFTSDGSKIDISAPSWTENWEDAGNNQWSYKGDKLITIEIMEGYSEAETVADATPETDTSTISNGTETGNNPVGELSETSSADFNNELNQVLNGQVEEAATNAAEKVTRGMAEQAPDKIAGFVSNIL